MIRITRKHFADKIDFLGYFTEINVLHRAHAGFNYLSLSFFPRSKILHEDTVDFKRDQVRPVCLKAQTGCI